MDPICEPYGGWAGRDHDKQVNYQSGHYRCPRYTVHGCNVSGRVLIVSSCRRMADVYFRSRRKAQLCTDDSPFKIVDCDIIRCFPSDCLHMLCLRITKRMLKFCQRFGAPRRALFSVQGLQRLNGYVLKIWPLTSCESPRVFRITDDLDYCNASEYRQVLLYIRPVLLKFWTFTGN